MLVQDNFVENLLENGLAHALEHEFHVLRADGASEVSVDHVRRLVLLQESRLDESRGGVKIAATCVVREAHFEVNSLYLLLEEVRLVEEQNESRIAEPVKDCRSRRKASETRASDSACHLLEVSGHTR